MNCQELTDQIEEYKPYNEQEEKDKRLILDWIRNNENAFSRENTVAHMTASAWGKRITWDSGGYGLPSVIWFPAVSLEFRLLWESFPQRLLRSFLTCCFLELREM